jgi:hypothetical protein
MGELEISADMRDVEGVICSILPSYIYVLSIRFYIDVIVPEEGP